MVGDHDIAIIGAGIGGSALATVLARAGVKVLLLEKTLVHKDVVRGEWLAPWGVVEATRLGLTDLYQAHGAHRIARHVSYGELLDRTEAEAQAIVFDDLGLERPLCLGHPATCNLLNAEAVGLGVTLLRGISRLEVTSGLPPTLRFEHEHNVYELRPRCIVGADGRNGVVAAQIGCHRTQDPEHHLFSGMLVEGARDWPVDLQVVATEGDVNVLAFPQGEGKVRIYLGWPSDDRTRLLGPEGPGRFLDSWQLECVPHAAAIAGAQPVSPCIAYPNSDSRVDALVRPGVVLIGDAAGRNDPIIGQGLSITHRDVRMVSEALLAHDDWQASHFDDYVEERFERMARLRTVARLTSLRDSAFGAAGRRQREQIHQRIIAQPDLATPFLAAFTGPEALPAEVFEPPFTEQIVGGPIWDALS